MARKGRSARRMSAQSPGAAEEALAVREPLDAFLRLQLGGMAHARGVPACRDPSRGGGAVVLPEQHEAGSRDRLLVHARWNEEVEAQGRADVELGLGDGA